MKNSRLTFPVLAAVGAALIIGLLVATVAAQTIIGRSIITAGGGTAAGGEASVSGLVGQAITGLSSGASTQIRGGWWSSTSGPRLGQAGFIPLITLDSCGAFVGAQECEDNDRPAQANGPLRFGTSLHGNVRDGNESKSDQNTEDWFYFDWPGDGGLTIDVTGFAPIGQLILYYQSVDQGALALVADEPSGVYHLTYDGSAGAGKYLVRLFVPGNQRPANSPDYTLVVTD
ncbi:MAG: hypothetical protein PVH65_12130 [Chloroflexota bacterium]|jgi:hypothetical protein